MPSNFPQLVVYANGGNYVVPLAQGTAWTLGRGKDCQVVLSDRWVSRRHALVQKLENGDYYLIDLGSRNGCTLNKAKITVPTLLKTGDRIALGKTFIEFRAAQAQTTIPPQADTPVDTLPDAAKIRPVVLIIQEHTSQSHLWRDLLLSQDINVIVESGKINVRQVLQDFMVMMQSHPGIVMLDTRAELPDVSQLLRWSYQQAPQLRVILIDGHDRIVSAEKRNWARQQRVLGYLPALPEDNFTIYSAEIEQMLKQILRVLAWGPVRREKLATTLLDLQMAVISDDTPSQWLGEFVVSPGNVQHPS